MTALNSISVIEAASEYCDDLFGAIVIDPITKKPKFSYYNFKEPCLVDGCIVLDNQFEWLSDP